MIDALTLDDAPGAVDELGFVIADPDLFASAIARPAITIFGADAYPDLPIKTTALLESVARNRALIDGNKRTAWVLMRLLLAINGAELMAGSPRRSPTARPTPVRCSSCAGSSAM